MEKSSTRSKITHYLQTHHGWVSGMEIEAKAWEWRSKRINRTLRDMSSGANATLDKRYGLNKAVQYRLRQNYSPPPPIDDKVNQGVLF